MKKATRQQTKEHNTRLVLKTIYERGNISRADVARATRLARPTVSAIVTGLLDAAFVVESGPGPSAGGKRPTLLNVAHDAHQLLAVDLGSQTFRGALVNLRGEIVERRNYPLKQRKGQAAVELVYQLVDALLQVASAPLLGLGLGTPGLVNPHQGIVRQAVNLGWNELPLRDLLAGRYQKPVYLANDSHMAALAEYTFGQPRDSSHLIVVKVGQGIGAGIVLNGQPYYGDGFGAGEIGHLVVANGRELCTCGNFGCLETVASTRAILRQAQQIAGREMKWEAIVKAVQAGDEALQAMVVQAGRCLGLGLAALVGSFNVHHLVVAGRVAQFGDLYLAAARSELERRVLPSLAAGTRLSYATADDDLVILGSSAMVLQGELGII
ncbi:MAG: ROK family protein [Chloroflexi bacterium]|nr:ROK family protein [Chloroflexota bacterium]MCI0581099.1 ROK family protein [Chloroflexota bacterium]MCI0649848.1 ROK family protein [Chloroflexota bacterium]MCI0731343.1 ROK family protein [Chloroflexota bacterium]